MSGDTVECRRAIDGDWPAIWPIFRSVVATGDTYTYPSDTAEADAREAWMPAPDRPDGRARTYVAIVDGCVVATARLRPNQPGRGDHVANGSWMVDPGAGGRGVGRALAEYVIDDARRLGFTAMQFNAVVATNTRAIALWESLGFGVVGTVPGAFRHAEHGAVDLHVMHRHL